MAIIQNPKKHFNFAIFTPGLQPLLAQKVTTPDWEFDIDEHGDLNYKVKTAGLSKIGMIKIEKISPVIIADNWVWDWMRDIQNTLTGGGLIPSLYKRGVIIQQLAPNNLSVLDSWTYDGVFPAKINGVEFSRVDSGNTMHVLEFSVDRPIKTV